MNLKIKYDNVKPIRIIHVPKAQLNPPNTNVPTIPKFIITNKANTIVMM